jgi:hypothetical protein
MGWGIAWRTALAVSAVAMSLAAALRWYLEAPSALIVIAVAAGSLLVGWRLPPARPVYAPQRRRDLAEHELLQ